MFIGTPFEEFLNLVKTLPRETFCRSHSGFYLLGKVSGDSPAGEMDFVTGRWIPVQKASTAAWTAVSKAR